MTVHDREAAFRIRVDHGSFATDMDWVTEQVKRAARQIAEFQEAARAGGVGGGSMPGSRGGARGGNSSEEQAIARTLKAKERAYEQERRLMLRIADEKQRAEDKAAQTAERAAQKKTTADERAAAKAVAAEKKVGEEAERSAKKAETAQQRSFDKQMAHYEAERSLIKKIADDKARAAERERQESARQDSEMRARLSMNASRGLRNVGTAAVGGTMRALGREASYVIGGTVGGMMRGTGLDRAMDVGSVVSQRLDAQEEIKRAAIEARRLGQRFDEGAAYNSLRDVTTKYGVSMEDATGAVRTGRTMGQGMETVNEMDTIGKFSLVSGASMSDVAKMRASVRTAGKGKYSSDQIDQVMATYTLAGQSGAFEMSDMARRSEMIMASQGRAQLDPLQAAKSYMGVLQMAKTTAGTTGQTVTAMMAAMSAAGGSQNHKSFAKLGVDTEDEGGQKDAITVMMEAVAAATDPDKRRTLGKIYTAQRGGKVTETLEEVANKASLSDKDQRMDAIMSYLASQTAKSGGGMEDINKQATELEGTDKIKFARAIAQFQEALEGAVVPALKSLEDELPNIVKAFKEMAPSIGPFIKFLTGMMTTAMEHPYAASALYAGGSGIASAIPSAVGAAGSYMMLKKALAVGAGGAAETAAAGGAAAIGGETAAIGVGAVAAEGGAALGAGELAAAGLAAIGGPATLAVLAVGAVAAAGYFALTTGTEDYDPTGGKGGHSGQKAMSQAEGHKKLHPEEEANVARDYNLRFGDMETSVDPSQQHLTDYSGGGDSGGGSKPGAVGDKMQGLLTSLTGKPEITDQFGTKTGDAAGMLDKFTVALENALAAIKSRGTESMTKMPPTPR